MKKIIVFFFLLTAFASSQNLYYTTFTCANNDSNITIDLSYDLGQIISDYYEGTEFRAIGFLFSGTWTNTTFTVYAAMTANGTYYAVRDESGTALTVTMASNRWVYLRPTEYAGMRFIKLVGATKEGGARTGYIVKRRY